MNKSKVRGCILVIIGILLVCCALGVHISQKQQDTIAGKNAAVLLQQLMGSVRKRRRLTGRSSSVFLTPAALNLLPMIPQ